MKATLAVAGFAAELHNLLSEHNQPAVFPPLLTLLAPHLYDKPVARDEPVLIDVDVVRATARLLVHHRAIDILDPVLALAAPYVAPRPPADDLGQPAGYFGEPLSQREIQVLRAMGDGCTNGEIGRQLYLSEDTIKTHARRMFRKLGAKDRAHAVRIGVEAGYIPNAVKAS